MNNKLYWEVIRMSDWLEEVEHLEKMCEETNGCENCKLGRCIKPESNKDGVNHE